MATRKLPGAYVTLNDLSQFPEGASSLSVGFVLKSDRGAVNEARLVTSPSDFLAKYTLSGTPKVSDDPTFWSILKVLAQTNSVYISRAANNPKFGGVVIKKDKTFGKIVSAVKETKTITLDAVDGLEAGALIVVTGTVKIDGHYTVDSVSGNDVVVKEALAFDFTAGEGSNAVVKGAPLVPLTNGLAKPEAYVLTADDLGIITGIDAGEYNNHLAFEIVSSVDNADALVYPNTMRLTVKDVDTNTVLETFEFSRDESAKTIDGISLFADNVMSGSAYVKFINNANVDATELPCSTVAGLGVVAGGGSAGDEVNESTMVGALNAFMDKTIPVSILGNGCSAQAETDLFQQSMLEIANTRKDLMVFLNTHREDEKATLNSDKATNIVTTKKELGSTSFFGTMYGPHVKTADTFNSRQVVIGADAVAIAGWLNVINNLNYPYAYAGPQNGLVTGVTCDWKIGDESGEAEILNDASVNYVAYDGKIGRYYMQCQNTLQVANSSMRNIGCVLNVLDIKEHLSTSLKEYGNLPITASLRRDILNNIHDYLDPMIGTRAYNLSFIDVTTEADLAQDTLRYLLTISLTRYSQIIYCAINVVGPNFDFSMVQSA